MLKSVHVLVNYLCSDIKAHGVFCGYHNIQIINDLDTHVKMGRDYYNIFVWYANPPIVFGMVNCPQEV